MCSTTLPYLIAFDLIVVEQELFFLAFSNLKKILFVSYSNVIGVTRQRHKQPTEAGATRQRCANPPVIKCIYMYMIWNVLGPKSIHPGHIHPSSSGYPPDIREDRFTNIGP